MKLKINGETIPIVKIFSIRKTNGMIFLRVMREGRSDVEFLFSDKKITFEKPNEIYNAAYFASDTMSLTIDPKLVRPSVLEQALIDFQEDKGGF